MAGLGPGALEEAKKKNRLILLSLSAVWCHWCHVMDETTYSDEEIISYINEHFIPIRVDADMRPDIDTLYNQGGWPSTAILTPEGEVLTGGTYIPPKEMLSRLKRADAFFRDDKAALADRLAELKAMKAPKKCGREGLRVLLTRATSTGSRGSSKAPLMSRTAGSATARSSLTPMRSIFCSLCI